MVLDDFPFRRRAAQKVQKFVTLDPEAARQLLDRHLEHLRY
jgi:hypothetical protein